VKLIRDPLDNPGHTSIGQGADKGNPQSAIRNPQLAIGNPQSAIRNPQLADGQSHFATGCSLSGDPP
jgi:hypothetical protein